MLLFNLQATYYNLGLNTLMLKGKIIEMFLFLFKKMNLNLINVAIQAAKKLMSITIKIFRKLLSKSKVFI